MPHYFLQTATQVLRSTLEHFKSEAAASAAAAEERHAQQLAARVANEDALNSQLQQV